MIRLLPAAPAALPALFATLLVLALAPAPAAAQTDLSVCRYLPRHRPAPDVEFKPGVDVNGRPVAPADLPGSAGTAAPLRLDIPVTLDFARRIGLVVPPTGLPGRTEVGRLTMDGGQLFFNGQPLGGPSESQLYALCRTAQ
ncbi:hypothetical protein [Azospirillum thermophilum]|uniref:Uncharacterized protein n=1 Tax=Azospirillum thermophilum TaxID=2202148 RepID=A0A2S2CMS8_9PROT|nr:hypothetical protein [Azospirillum thermophilum]AWK85782.1 hypothetical protein DEW08_06020 [Azospirillum thermophilum]